MMKKSGANSINLVKQVISVLSSITKSKAMAIKSKAAALKARLIMCSLLRNKRLPLAAVISRKVHAILGVGGSQLQHEDSSSSASCDDQEYCKANGHSHYPSASCETEEGHVDYYCNYCYNNNNNDDDDKYPDLRHCLFNEYYQLENDDQVQQGGGDEDDPKNGSSSSVIDMVKNTKEQEGEDFRLEDEIDHVADLFITKFHKMMKLQKLESFKRYQDMLATGAAARN